MQVKVVDEAGFQILTSAMSIGPSQTGYVLEVSADGKNFSPLFSVGANTTKMATNLAPNSYYRLKGNVGEVIVNWSRSCVTEGGGGASGNELAPVSEFPIGAMPGTVVAYSGASSAAGVYMYDGTDWNSAGGDVDLSNYYTSAQTEEKIASAVTPVANHLAEVEQITASALTELHDDILELSARTPDMSGYWTSAETKTYVDSAITGVQEQIDTMDEVVAASLVDLNERVATISAATPSVDLSGYYTSAQTEDAISSALTPYYTSAQTNTAISAATQDMVTSTTVRQIVKLTQAEYDILTPKDPYTFYIIVNSN